MIDSLESSAELNARYQSAISGQTGIDCFDAWAAELVRTGYLHNHARMWFASIWIFTLELPWQLGADFFYRHLLDGDPASNTLSWRWVGGLHTAGKTYQARASNIARYTDNRFNPQGQLARSAPPLSESIEHPLQQLPAAHTGPLTMRYGLFLTEEDCFPESLIQGDNPSCILGAVSGASRSPLATGHHAAEFACAAVKDALRRAEHTFGVHGEHAADDDWARMLGDWAQRENIRFMVTAYAPAGPVADRLVQARAALSARDIQLVQIRRRYDTLTWPEATRVSSNSNRRSPEPSQPWDLLLSLDCRQRRSVDPRLSHSAQSSMASSFESAIALVKAASTRP